MSARAAAADDDDNAIVAYRMDPLPPDVEAPIASDADERTARRIVDARIAYFKRVGRLRHAIERYLDGWYPKEGRQFEEWCNGYGKVAAARDKGWCGCMEGPSQYGVPFTEAQMKAAYAEATGKAPPDDRSRLCRLLHSDEAFQRTLFADKYWLQRNKSPGQLSVVDVPLNLLDLPHDRPLDENYRSIQAVKDALKAARAVPVRRGEAVASTKIVIPRVAGYKVRRRRRLAAPTAAVGVTAATAATAAATDAPSSTRTGAAGETEEDTQTASSSSSDEDDDDDGDDGDNGTSDIGAAAETFTDGNAAARYTERELLALLRELYARTDEVAPLVAEYVAKVPQRDYDAQRRNALAGTSTSSSYVQNLMRREPLESVVRYERFIVPALGARLLVDRSCDVDDDDDVQAKRQWFGAVRACASDESAWWQRLAARYPFLDDIQVWHGAVRSTPLEAEQKAIFYDVLARMSPAAIAALAPAPHEARLRTEIDEARASAAAVLAELDAARKTNDALRTEKTECESGRARLDAQLQALEQDLVDTRAERDAAQRALDEAGEERAAHTTAQVLALAEQREQRDELQAKVGACEARAAALDERIAQLRAEMAAIVRREADVQAESDKNDGERARLQADVDALTQRVDALKADAAQCAQALGACTAARNAVGVALGEATTANEATRDDAERAVAALRDDVRRASTERDEARTALVAAESAVAALRADVERASTERDEALAVRDEARSALDALRAEAERDADAARTALAAATADAQRAQAALDALRADSGAVGDALRAERRQRAEVDERVQALEGEVVAERARRDEAQRGAAQCAETLGTCESERRAAARKQLRCAESRRTWQAAAATCEGARAALEGDLAVHRAARKQVRDEDVRRLVALLVESGLVYDAVRRERFLARLDADTRAEVEPLLDAAVAEAAEAAAARGELPPRSRDALQFDVRVLQAAVASLEADVAAAQAAQQGAEQTRAQQLLELEQTEAALRACRDEQDELRASDKRSAAALRDAARLLERERARLQRAAAECEAARERDVERIARLGDVVAAVRNDLQTCRSDGERRLDEYDAAVRAEQARFAALQRDYEAYRAAVDAQPRIAPAVVDALRSDLAHVQRERADLRAEAERVKRLLDDALRDASLKADDAHKYRVRWESAKRTVLETAQALKAREADVRRRLEQANEATARADDLRRQLSRCEAQLQASAGAYEAKLDEFRTGEAAVRDLLEREKDKVRTSGDERERLRAELAACVQRGADYEQWLLGAKSWIESRTTASVDADADDADDDDDEL